MERLARFETLTRLGFAARGLLYLVVAYLALRTGQTTGTSGALESLAGDIGALPLLIIALGLFAYGIWRIAEAALDLEGQGSNTKGSVTRAAHGLSGAAHVLLGVAALSLALGSSSTAGDSAGAQGTTSWLLGFPGGAVAVRLLGVVLLALGLSQIIAAVKLRFLRQLDPRAAQQAWVHWVGRLGYMARGIVFGLVGIFFWRAGSSANPQDAGGMGEALAALPGWSQTAVAAGLALFGIFSIVQAIHRRITDPHVVERLKAHMA